jgi:mono/diheme cytochrome c family protein
MRLQLLKSAGQYLILTLSLLACGARENANQPGSAIDPALASSLASGEQLYKQYCLACHLASGIGAPPMNPPLIKTSFVLGNKKALIGIVLNGMSNVPVDGERYRNVMPSFGYLTDKDVADVLTYVRKNFGNDAEAIGESEVAKERASGKVD